MEPKLIKALHRIIEILDKYKIQYRISGWFSAYLYGANRPINDIDIDIPEDDFEKIYDNIKEYIILWPEEYQDQKRNLKLITLNYFGQEIDIWWAFHGKIFDDIRQEWIPNPVDFSKSRKMNIDGLEIHVIDPNDLIHYKQLLSGEHQKIDIKAVQQFIQNT